MDIQYWDIGRLRPYEANPRDNGNAIPAVVRAEQEKGPEGKSLRASASIYRLAAAGVPRSHATTGSTKKNRKTARHAMSPTTFSARLQKPDLSFSSSLSSMFSPSQWNGHTSDQTSSFPMACASLDTVSNDGDPLVVSNLWYACGVIPARLATSAFFIPLRASKSL